ncbi:hypothetical protein C0Q70_20605 [Pomacea canaliculata]|uniref:Elongator complex protein 1 n=1 Tax=Pomacea canaliculata TaxID=400727 RepID=A0A2T7NG11_POMCA|nr:hypothetical protein C0Q70_20605 [Pomacea canaliculata]
MRNLKLLHSHLVIAPLDLTGCSHITVNPDTGHVILVTNTDALVLDPATSEIIHRRSLLVDEVLSESGTGKVIGLQFLPDQHGTCIATSNGNLSLWIPDVDEFECVGVVENGLSTMCWSPDQELFILITGKGMAVIMTREFEAITEILLHSEEFGEGEFITVGWGKKETQFHGSEGKQAAKQKRENLQPASASDDLMPRVSWRGDGQLFAISSINPSTGARIIRVWSREGILQSTSEPMNGLEQALAWKPSGSLIASTQRKPNKHDVVFFEKNGLQHGEFTLNFGLNEVVVKELMWNPDSTILAVWSEDLPNSSGENTFHKSHVQLWTCSNYHWSLKQNLTFSCKHGNVVAMIWDPEHFGRLHLVTSTGQYLQYTWTSVTNHSHGQTSHDPANVFVINGSTVGITPLRKMVVPPPMSAYQLHLPSHVSQVTSPTFPPNIAGDIAVLTDDNQLIIFGECTETAATVSGDISRLDAAGGRGFRPQCTIPNQKASYSLVLPGTVSNFPLSITHMCWPRQDTFVFSTHGLSGPVLCLCQLPQEKHSVQTNPLELGSLIPVEESVISLAADIEGQNVAVQLVSGLVLKLCLDTGTLLPWETKQKQELKFPHISPQMEITSFAGEEVVVGLTDRFRFYVNNVEVASNCTSFAIHNEFLLLTTLSHTVRCIHRHTSVRDLASLSDGKAHPFDESIRRVERGSRIVVVVAEDTKLVLQMPRGNLETIHPRALVLSSVRRLLDRYEYSKALIIMKKHRINLNLIHDHNPQAFLEHVSNFIQQISSVSDLNLFLTELQDEDVTKTMYTAAYDPVTKSAASAVLVAATSSKCAVSKVDIICDTVRSALEREDAEKYRLCILTAFVKKSSPDLQKALELIWASKTLATYNFDLVLMVAEKSQKDPKEYIPFLNQLRRMEENYCKFTIDRHLKKYSSALHHIALCGPEHFNECVDLVQGHKLYTEALKLFSPDSQQFKTLAQEYGCYLKEKNRHDEAGIVFARAELWQMAFDAFVAALDWRKAFCMAARLQLDATQIAEMGRKLAVRLKDSKQFCEAAVVYEQYAKDIEEAVATLIEGSQWSEALRLMYTYQRIDIVETHLKKAIANACTETKAMLENQQAEMERYVQRLATVRQEKECTRKMLLMQDHNDNMADLLSDITSVTGESIQSSKYSVDSNRSTVFSKATGRSNRTRRKAEHKKWSLKEGSPFEDCALIDAIAKIIKTVDSMRDQYEALLEEVQRVVPLVWQEDTSSPSAVLGPAMTANAIAQAVQQGQGLDSARTEPVLQIPPILKKDVRWKLHMLQGADK